MFEQSRLIQSVFSVVFSRDIQIRRRANDFEDRLKGQYRPPQVLPLPDEMSPALPRLIFESVNGYSQILVSQNTAALSVRYSPDYQVDTARIEAYLVERSPLLFELLALLQDNRLFFQGMSTQVQLDTTASNEDIIEHLTTRFLSGQKKAPLDLMLRTTNIVGDTFFSNITIQNYRSWDVDAAEVSQSGSGLSPLAISKASRRGVQINGDFNDRYAYNELTGYQSSADLARKLIEKALIEIRTTVDLVQRVQ